MNAGGAILHSSPLPNVRVELAGTATAPIDNTSDGGNNRNINFGNVTITSPTPGSYLRFIVHSTCSNSASLINSLTVGATTFTYDTTDTAAKAVEDWPKTTNMACVTVMDQGWPSINVQVQVRGSGSNTSTNTLAVLRLKNLINPGKAQSKVFIIPGSVANLTSQGGGIVLISGYHTINADPTLGNLAQAYTEVLNRVSGPGMPRGMYVYYKVIDDTNGISVVRSYPLTNTTYGGYTWVNLAETFR